MNYPEFSASVESVGASLVATASKIRHLVKNPDLFALEIGVMVDQKIRRSGGYSADALHELSKLSGVPARKLGAFHEVCLTVRLAGPGFVECLPTCSYAVYRQLARVLKADGSLPWKRDVLFRVATKTNRGLLALHVGGVLDQMLGGCRSIETRNSSEPWNYRILSEVAMKIEAFVAVQSVAA